MNEKLYFFSERKANKGNVWLLFLLFGWSYGSLDKMGKQIFFYLTGGGITLWWFYRLFTLNSAIKEYNKKIAIELGLTDEEIKLLGL